MAKALLLWFIWQVVLVFSYATKPIIYLIIINHFKMIAYANLIFQNIASHLQKQINNLL